MVLRIRTFRFSSSLYLQLGDAALIHYANQFTNFFNSHLGTGCWILDVSQFSQNFGRRSQDLASGFRDHNRVLDADSAQSFQIRPRLDG